MRETLSIDDVNANPKGGVYKFVRLSNEQFIFTLVGHSSLEHRQLVQEGETAVAAGTIYLFADSWRISDHYSSTLQLGTTKEATAALKQLIARKYKASSY